MLAVLYEFPYGRLTDAFIAGYGFVRVVPACILGEREKSIMRREVGVNSTRANGAKH